MKNLVRVLFALLFMVVINACSDGFAEANDQLIEERSDTTGAKTGSEGP